jgi:hypothetical protein
VDTNKSRVQQKQETAMQKTMPQRTVSTDRLSALGILSEPLGYVDGMSQYEYVGSNPVNRVDPNGLKLIIRGSAADQKSIRDILNAAHVKADDELAALLEEIATSDAECVITVSNNDAAFIDDFRRQIIDLADIKALPYEEGYSQVSQIVHVVVEQWKKQVNGMRYPQAHNAALDAEERCGNKRTSTIEKPGVKIFEYDVTIWWSVYDPNGPNHGRKTGETYRAKQEVYVNGGDVVEVKTTRPPPR